MQQMPALVPNLNLAEAETERQINNVNLDKDFELAREESIKKNCRPVVSAIYKTPTEVVFEPLTEREHKQNSLDEVSQTSSIKRPKMT